MALPDDLSRLLGKFPMRTLRLLGGLADGQLGLGGVGARRTMIVKTQAVGQRHVVFDMDVVSDPSKQALGPDAAGMLKTAAAAGQYAAMAALPPRLETHALNVLTDLGDHALRSLRLDWFADCGDSDLCSLHLAEQLQRIGAGTVLQRVRGEDFRTAVWTFRDLRAGCVGCAMTRGQRDAAHRIHSCTNADREPPERAAAALAATQAAAAAHAVQEQWLLAHDPSARPANYVLRLNAETGGCRIIEIQRSPDCRHHPEPIPWQQVRLLSGATTRTLRPIDLMNETGSQSLSFDRPLVQLAACQRCDARYQLDPPTSLAVLLAAGAGCPSCGGDLRALLAGRRVSRESASARRTLLEIGMPLGHVYRLSQPEAWLAIDDAAELFAPDATPPKRTWSLQPLAHADATAAWMAGDA